MKSGGMAAEIFWAFDATDDFLNLLFTFFFHGYYSLFPEKPSMRRALCNSIIDCIKTVEGRFGQTGYSRRQKAERRG
jgi:hypothetical protein